MSRVTVEDVRLWTGIIASVIPAGGQLVTLTVDAVASVIRAVKQLRGEAAAQDDPGPTLLAEQVIGMLEAAKSPWVRISATSSAELDKLARS